MAATLTQVRSVLAQMAHAMAAAPTNDTVGRFQLRDVQRETCAALHTAMQAHGGALLADAPGSGKTVVALAVAASYADVLVLTPSAIRSQWQRAAARARVAVRIESHEALSHGRIPEGAPLIVVDEAHHFRNPATQRYRTLATLASGQHLLLLSATPVVNRIGDREALLRLFVGSGRAQDARLQQAVIVRRATQVTLATAQQRLADLAHAAAIPGLGTAIAALPPPFPAADGTAATALVRMSLAMAWASSLAALDAALRRRMQRGHALAERLAAGHWPTRHALGFWLHGEDATQLALPLLGADASVAPSEALAMLTTHLAAVEAIRARIALHVSRDIAARASALRALLDAERPRRVLLLAQHTDTVRGLQRALQQVPGVVAIIGQRVHAAAGRWTRDEVVAALGPDAAPWRAEDPRGIRLVLATDILSEGVELQGCATVVHGDLAWTPARLEQRVGRVARSGQRDEVHVTQFAVPAAAERLVQMQQRLLRKRRLRTSALAAADAARRLEELLAAVRNAGGIERDSGSPGRRAGASREGAAGQIAFVHSQRCGFLALLTREDSAPQLVAGEFRQGRWRISTAASYLLRVLEVALRAPAAVQCTRDASGRSRDRQALHTARRVLRRWIRARRSRRTVHGDASMPEPLLRRARRALDAWVVSQPLAQRAPAFTRVSRILSALATLRGSGAEQSVEQALRTELPGSRVAALEALATASQNNGAHPSSDAPLCLSALVILRPTSAGPAPRAPSSETAATR